MLQIGIDFGHTAVKVVGVNHTLVGSRFVGASITTLPAGAITKQAIMQPEELAAVVRAACASAKPHPLVPTRVVSALPASSILTKLLELPAMSGAELARAIPFEASQALPVPLEELYLDWIVASEPRHPHALAWPKKTNPPAVPAAPKGLAPLEILVIAAPKVLVDSYVSFFDQAGIELAALDIKPIANARALSLESQTDTYLLVDFGGVDSSIAVIDQGNVRTISTIEFGADLLHGENPGPPALEQIANGKQPVEGAPDPRFKIQDSKKLPKRTKPTRPQMKQNAPDSKSDVLKQQLLPLAQEIEHMAKFYEHRVAQSGRLNRIRLCGGGANTPGVVTALAEMTNLRVEVAHPFTSHGFLAGPDDPALTTALGLALYGHTG